MEETKDKKKEAGNSLRGYWDDLVKHWEPGPVSLPSHESVKCYKLLSNSTLESDSDVKKKKKNHFNLLPRFSWGGWCADSTDIVC